MRQELANKIVLVLILILALIQLFSSVLIVGPNDKTFDRTPKFSWYGGYDNYRLIVDDDYKFGSPEINVITKNYEYVPNNKLDPGTYYWKVIGFSNGKEVNSLTGNFVLESYVGYSLSGNNLVNIGNVISSLNGPTGAAILDIGETKKLDGGNYFIQQNE